MDEKYISFYIVCCIFGICDLIFQIILDILGYYYGNFIYFQGVKVNFSSINDIEINASVFLKSLPFVISYIIFYCFYYVIIDKFTAVHGAILEIFTLLADNLIDLIKYKNVSEALLFGFLFSCIIFSLFVFTEIIELNFCGLNKNTRRNIIKRENIEKSKYKYIIEERKRSRLGQLSKSLTDLDSSDISLDEQYKVEMDQLSN